VDVIAVETGMFVAFEAIDGKATRLQLSRRTAWQNTK